MAAFDDNYSLTELFVNNDGLPLSNQHYLFIWCRECMREEETTHCNGEIQMKRPLSGRDHPRMILYKTTYIAYDSWAHHAINGVLRTDASFLNPQYADSHTIERIVAAGRESDEARARLRSDMTPRARGKSFSTFLRHQHREHATGCLHSSTPEVIVQGTVKLAKSLYWKHCDGRYLNVCREEVMTDDQRPAAKSE